MSLPHTLPEPVYTSFNPPSRHAQAVLPPEANTATCSCADVRHACPTHRPWEYAEMSARHRTDLRPMRTAVYVSGAGWPTGSVL